MQPTSRITDGAGLSRRHERLAIAALTLGAFAMALNANVVGPMLNYIELDPLYAGLDAAGFKQQMGVLIASASAAGAVAALALGPVVDSVGRRGPMVFGGVVFAVASLLHLLADSHALLVAVRAAAGFGTGLVFTGASAAVADIVPYARRGAAMGVFSAGLFLAVPLGLPVAVELARLGEWRGIFAVQAGIGLLATAAFLIVIPRGLGRSQHRASQWTVLRQPMVAPGLLSVLIYTGAFFAVVQFVSKWLDDEELLPRDEQRWLWVVLGLNMAVGSLLLPRLADRFGKLNFVLISTAGVAICMILLSRAETLATVVAVGVPFTLLAAARTGPLQALLSEIVEPRMRGTLMGIRAAAVNLGIAGFSTAAGAVYAGRGYVVVLWGAAFSVIASYLLVRWFVRE